MEVSLTAGAIKKMLNGEVTSEKNMMPILQVTDLKLLQTKKNDSSHDRYRVSFSDGFQAQQGMLNASLNVPVTQGRIQVGSIVKLTHFTCNVVLHRRIVIVADLDVILEYFDLVGNPVQSPLEQQQQQRGPVAVNTQSIGGAQQQGTRSEMSAGYGSSNVGYEGFKQEQVRAPPAAAYSRPVQSSNMPQSPPSTRPYGSSNLGYEGPRQEEIRAPPQTAYSRPLQSSYHPQSPPSARPYGSSNAGYDGSRQEEIRAPPQTAYSHPVQPGYQPQPPPMYANRGPVARNEAPARIIPISGLNPYQGRWTIKVRVTSKGELRHYNNTRGDGKVFSFDLLDADKGEIRVTCFNDVVDRFHDQIVVGNVYLISKGTLKPARKEFNHLRNDYEIFLDSASTIQQCQDDPSIPHNQFHFSNIGDIQNMEVNSITDLIGIVWSISPTGSIMRKNGTEVPKRAFQLKDMSGRSVEVTMWGNFCNTDGQKLQNLCDSGVFPVLAVKTGKIGDFQGKQVSTIGSTQLFIEPDIPEARVVREWYEREGRNAPCVSISREFSGIGRQDVRKVITQIKDENLGTSEKPDWITVGATIAFMKVDNFCYTACPTMNGERPCSKKVTNNGDGTWRCEKCDKCVPECDYRYILQLQLQDHTGVTWATAFQEAGEEIIGMSAKDLYYIKFEHHDEEKFEDIIRQATFTKYIFKLKIKEETYSDEQRVKATIVKAEKLSYTSDTRFMQEAMNKLKAEDANSLPINPEGSNYRFDAFNSGIGASGTRETAYMDVPRREYGLPPAANQATQYGNQYSNVSRPLGGITSCNGCGSSGHVSANCPSLMSEPQGQYTSGAYGSTPGRYAGGGIPRQHVGGY